MALKMSLKNKKNILLLALIFCCCFVAGGYFYLMHQTSINGSVRFAKQDTWNINFKSIETKNILGQARNYKEPVLSNYEVTFYTEFWEPGDSISYDVKVKNGGTLNARVDNIKFYSNIIEQVNCQYEGIQKGMILNPNQEATITVKLTYSPKNNAKPREDGKVSLVFDWVQAN